MHLMPAKDRLTVAMNPKAHASLDRIYERAAAEGVDLTYIRPGGTRVRSESAAVRHALDVAARMPWREPVRPGSVPGPTLPSGGARATTTERGAGGERLLAARRRAGLTQEQVGEAAGVSEDQVRRVELGQRETERYPGLLAWVEGQERAGEGAD